MLIQTFPPRLMCRVMAIRADSICRLVTYAGSRAWMPNSPNVTAVPPLAAPERPGWCCLRCLTLRGMSMSALLCGAGVGGTGIGGAGIGNGVDGGGVRRHFRVERATLQVGSDGQVARRGRTAGGLARVDAGHRLSRCVGHVGRAGLGGVGRLGRGRGQPALAVSLRRPGATASLLGGRSATRLGAGCGGAGGPAAGPANRALTTGLANQCLLGLALG